VKTSQYITGAMFPPIQDVLETVPEEVQQHNQGTHTPQPRTVHSLSARQTVSERDV
jgi:hypothetical protein